MIVLSKCTLRSFRLGDEDSLHHHANNLAVWNNLRDSFPHPYLKSDAVDWISYHHLQLKPLNLAITIEDHVIGGIGLVPQTDIYKLNAEISYWLGESYWGKGIMTDAMKGIVDYAFANFKIIRIYAGVFDYNTASMRVLEKAGFHKEAVHQKAIFKNGQIFDEHLFTFLNPNADKLL